MNINATCGKESLKATAEQQLFRKTGRNTYYE